MLSWGQREGHWTLTIEELNVNAQQESETRQEIREAIGDISQVVWAIENQNAPHGHSATLDDLKLRLERLRVRLNRMIHDEAPRG